MFMKIICPYAPKVIDILCLQAKMVGAYDGAYAGHMACAPKIKNAGTPFIKNRGVGILKEFLYGPPPVLETL